MILLKTAHNANEWIHNFKTTSVITDNDKNDVPSELAD
jgi:hypothetical protein